MKRIALAIAVLGVVMWAGPKSRPTYAQVPTANPAQWVAFDASFVRTEPGQRRVVAWFHRGADGSTREESNVDGPARPVVLIMNVARRRQYRFENGAWASYPVNLPPDGL